MLRTAGTDPTSTIGAMVVTPHKRQRILERDEWKCFWCRRPLAQTELEIDPGATHRTIKLNMEQYRNETMRLALTNPSAPAWPTIDHIVPRVRGGTDHEFNLVASCLDCNNTKGNLMPDEWARVKNLTQEQHDFALQAHERFLRHTATSLARRSIRT